MNYSYYWNVVKPQAKFPLVITFQITLNSSYIILLNFNLVSTTWSEPQLPCSPMSGAETMQSEPTLGIKQRCFALKVCFSLFRCSDRLNAVYLRSCKNTHMHTRTDTHTHSHTLSDISLFSCQPVFTCPLTNPSTGLVFLSVLHLFLSLDVFSGLFSMHGEPGTSREQDSGVVVLLSFFPWQPL